MCGQLDVPIKGLRDNLSLRGNSSQQEHFWGAMERLTMEQRSLMLKFGSGRSRLPCHLTIHLGEFCYFVHVWLSGCGQQVMATIGSARRRHVVSRCTCLPMHRKMLCMKGLSKPLRVVHLVMHRCHATRAKKMIICKMNIYQTTHYYTKQLKISFCKHLLLSCCAHLAHKRNSSLYGHMIPL